MFLSFDPRTDNPIRLCNSINTGSVFRVLLHCFLNILMIRNFAVFLFLSFISISDLSKLYSQQVVVDPIEFILNKKSTTRTIVIKVLCYCVVCIFIIHHLNLCGLSRFVFGRHTII
ncbi:protein cornichon [Anaeramoeba flamelloides]|uniref:Protein cornichon n=1 Tax=Anaeramoeba flamelloides TaxID=1746091 RepID=A0AAV8A0A0_9EUKA|nr:protein cornichon [Anaeramoeba flamelloides]KAJ6232550.1 protein cornichon [Anaeramoeba flamelloides]